MSCWIKRRECENLNQGETFGTLHHWETDPVLIWVQEGRNGFEKVLPALSNKTYFNCQSSAI